MQLVQDVLPNDLSSGTIEKQMLDCFPLITKPTTIIVNHAKSMKYFLRSQSVMTCQPQSKASSWSSNIVEKQLSPLDHWLSLYQTMIDQLSSELGILRHLLLNQLLHKVSLL